MAFYPRFRVIGLLVCVASIAVGKAGKAGKSVGEPLLELTDDTLQAALDEHPLMLLTIGVDGCEPCAIFEKRMSLAKKELRVKSSGSVTLAKLTITSQDSPVIGNIVQGQLTLPKMLIFRDGEAMDYDAEPTKAGMVEAMLREISRDSVLLLKNVKQVERFLYIDSWCARPPHDACLRPWDIRACDHPCL